MPQTCHTTALALALTAAAAAAQPLSEDFESHAVGTMPGAPWQDVTSRIENPTVPPPTGEIVTTTDAAGGATQAFRINDAFGTSQGILAEIGPSPQHTLSSSIRIDSLADDRGWPIAAGFIGQTPGATDFNQAVQCVIYADREFNWHLFIKKDLNPGQDQIIPGAKWALGQWYDFDMAFDVESGALDVSVTNATSGVVEASKSRVVSLWKGKEDVFDAIAFFDGEYATADSHGAVTLIDNVVYTVPSPATAVPFLGLVALAPRRRR